MTGLSPSTIAIFPPLSIVLIIAHVLSTRPAMHHIRLIVSYFTTQTLLVIKGCSVLQNSDIVEQIINVHTVVKEFLTNILHFVLAEDVKRKTS
jgi:hypothetical protein